MQWVMGYLTVGTWLGNAMGYGLSYCGYVVRECNGLWVILLWVRG